MTNVQCPYCGATLSKRLKYCVSCQRAVSTAEIKKIGFKIFLHTREDSDVPSSFALSKQSYAAHRQARTFFYTLSSILLLTIIYYSLMRFVLHVHLPGDIDVWLEQIINGSQMR